MDLFFWMKVPVIVGYCHVGPSVPSRTGGEAAVFVGVRSLTARVWGQTRLRDGVVWTVQGKKLWLG